jgi:diguanylate cyclase (GGDEF)-like protein
MVQDTSAETRAEPAHPPLHDDASRQRLRASLALVALVVYVVFAGVQQLEVMMGLVDAADSWRLSAFNVGGGLMFYGLMRSGLNRHVRGDPSLNFPQMLWAMTGISWAYAITGPARGGVILIMMLIIVFGMFALTAGQARVIAATGFAMLGGVMLCKALTDPVRYPPRVEILHFAFAGIVMGAVAVLSGRLGALRARLERQRADLTVALERIQALATRDELTGLLNRRAVLDRLQIELRERDARAPQLCVALIDLDHFKRVNDNHGHAAGDEVLRRFAEAARQVVRGGDVMARWGGEEFLLMLPGASLAQGLDSLARIRIRLGEMAMADIHPELVVTFSAGLADCQGPADLERAIERADAAMYAAKKAGRNRSVAAPVYPSAGDAAECATLAASSAEVHTPE